MVALQGFPMPWLSRKQNFIGAPSQIRKIPVTRHLSISRFRSNYLTFWIFAAIFKLTFDFVLAIREFTRSFSLLGCASGLKYCVATLHRYLMKIPMFESADRSWASACGLRDGGDCGVA
jgi:hypothetical protein